MVHYEIVSAANCPPALYRFRYEVYVEELHRAQSYACHEERTIIDPLDEAGHNLIARDGDEIVGCVRLNFVRDGGVQPYFDFYELERLSPLEIEGASICTRYMVAPRYRRSRVPIELLKRIYLHGLENGATSCYMDTNAPYQKLYVKLGYDSMFEKVHADYGLVSIMRLEADNLEKLTAARSPFAPILKKFLSENCSLEPA